MAMPNTFYYSDPNLCATLVYDQITYNIWAQELYCFRMQWDWELCWQCL